VLRAGTKSAFNSGDQNCRDYWWQSSKDVQRPVGALGPTKMLIDSEGGPTKMPIDSESGNGRNGRHGHHGSRAPWLGNTWALLVHEHNQYATEASQVQSQRIHTRYTRQESK